MNVLLMWNELPEDWNFIPLYNLNAATVEKLKAWHGSYINAGKNPHNDAMHAFFYDGHGEFMFEPLKTKEIQTEKFDLVLVMGFLL